MKKTIVLHNPGAGEGETTKRDLIDQIEAAGFECSYSSTKHFRWENLETDDVDLIVLAGGDGTVRKVAELLLDRRVTDKKIPLGLLPLGTANNIAKTLRLTDSLHDIINGWPKGTVKKFDVGVIEGFGKPGFFLEGFGFGLFPKLMKEMEKQGKSDLEDPKEKLRAALEILHELVLVSPLKKCKLQLDEIDYSGEFLLIEVMNIRSIGPNLTLAPEADPGDGEFDVVLISEKQRKHLAEYVRKKIDGAELAFDFPLLKAKQMTIHWDGKHAHIDDEYHKLDKPVGIKIELREGLLEFLVPKK
jgi:diacylglycerol kinase (ATP)